MSADLAKRSLVWLASYPKSGNTWLRAFLTNYLHRPAEGGPAPLSALTLLVNGDVSRPSYVELAGHDAPDRDLASLLALRRRHLARIASNASLSFVKTHHPNASMLGQPLIPPELTRAAVLIVRNPIDVVPSYADHFALSPEKAAAQLANPKNWVPGGEKVVPQFLGAWSQHVASWAGARDFPVTVIRYEDMLATPRETFGHVVRSLGLPEDEAALDEAIANSSFEVLRAAEAETGFAERGQAQARFFRQGSAGHGVRDLPPGVVARLRSDHGAIMRKLGYAP